MKRRIYKILKIIWRLFKNSTFSLEYTGFWAQLEWDRGAKHTPSTQHIESNFFLFTKNFAQMGGHMRGNKSPRKYENTNGFIY